MISILHKEFQMLRWKYFDWNLEREFLWDTNDCFFLKEIIFSFPLSFRLCLSVFSFFRSHYFSNIFPLSNLQYVVPVSGCYALRKKFVITAIRRGEERTWNEKSWNREGLCHFLFFHLSLSLSLSLFLNCFRSFDIFCSWGTRNSKWRNITYTHSSNTWR